MLEAESCQACRQGKELDSESCQACRQDKELDSDTEDSGNQDMSRIKSILHYTMLKVRMEINFEESKRHHTVKRNPF